MNEQRTWFNDNWDTIAPNAEAGGFVQWKGTDVCIDWTCGNCNATQHVDGYFAYFVQCVQCSAVYQLSSQIRMRRVTTAEIEAWGVEGVVRWEDDGRD